MNTKIALGVLSLSLLAAAAQPAVAQPNAAASRSSVWDDITLIGNIGLASQYRYRGLMQTNNKPAIQGGFDLSHTSGLYIGNWNSNISSLSDSNSDVSTPIEMDFYGGYKAETAFGMTFDVGAIAYYYPGDYPDGLTSPDTTEFYAGIGYGPLAFKYSHALTNLFGVAGSKNSQYYDLSGSFPTPFWGLAVNVHAGHQRVRNLEDGSYTDWSVGLKRSWDNGFAVTLTYMDTNADETVYTNAKGRYIGKQTVIAQLSKSF
ncbi:TorF family putative porin [Castellaniella sp.]|uniref:TorF family putative porin n=1 Tax=Castellaniella sp. TaxID=1955812 RepID=UPI002AFF8093|nr:TorF family putative porin [Castellaniella sp.]